MLKDGRKSSVVPEPDSPFRTYQPNIVPVSACLATFPMMVSTMHSVEIVLCVLTRRTVCALEWDIFHTLVMDYELGEICSGVRGAITGSSVIGAPPIVHYGTEEQKSKWLPGIFTGETSFCLGATEPTGESTDFWLVLTKALGSIQSQVALISQTYEQRQKRRRMASSTLSMDTRYVTKCRHRR